MKKSRPLPLRIGGALYRRARSLYSKFQTYSDIASVRVHNALLARPETMANGEARAIRVRYLKGSPVYCRPGTTDVNVFDDTFFGLYHLPPAELGPIRTILDLGSNIGLTIAHYSVLFPEARILGIEMDRGNFETCQRNIEPFRAHCEVINGAVWITGGEVGYEGTMNSAFSVTAGGGGGQAVQAYTMDQLLTRLGVPVVDFVKMDVEGAEALLLESVQEWGPRVRSIKIEIHEPFTVQDCIRMLEPHGFECRRDTRHWACVTALNRRPAGSGKA